MSINLQALKKVPLYEQIAEQIKKEISEGRLQPGDKLPSERELAEQLGVSRVPVREAIGMLRLMGVIETKYGGGATVKGLEKSRVIEEIDMLISNHTDDKLDLIEARLVIETGCTKLACIRRNEKDLERLKEAIAAMQKEVDEGKAPVESSMEFHRAVLMATKNKVLYRMAMMFSDLLRQTRVISLNRPDRPHTAIEEHLSILKAIVERDSETAAQLMETHLKATLRVVEEAANLGKD